VVDTGVIVHSEIDEPLLAAETDTALDELSTKMAVAANSGDIVRAVLR
jgi:hypothetical protein